MTARRLARPQAGPPGPMKGRHFLICPACTRRGVRLFMRANGEDGYSCRYCEDFDAFTHSDLRTDRNALRALARANPGRESEVVGLPEDRTPEPDPFPSVPHVPRKWER